MMALPSVIKRISEAGTFAKARKAVGARRLRLAEEIGAIVYDRHKICLTEVGYLLIRAVSKAEIAEAIEMKHLLADRERF